jgi:large subunit ribosomal protein L17
MKHGIKQKKLNRGTEHRKALLANLAISLIEHEQITTTLAKAKALRPYVEKLITLGKKGDLNSRRIAISKLCNNDVIANKLFDVLGKRYEGRNGGYTRIIRFGFRTGDSAPKAVIEFVDRDIKAKGHKDLERVKAEREALEEFESQQAA